ncbi:hypothetical protein SAMN05660461_0223 [Chitinophaga ginsengisegetis]|uniref:PA14 domain-containing protein n=1 Tax=Chitinophaga ginsengisegetis TaxID=393003 RepID=A0A1T5N415_9BACT|nr:hypothetical protein [Chitinophaga ginsengisegetis]SKC95084.1 hypothetical protein SAMN05660461_0223 [Chitinophaga ginsengisegetis]
MIPGNIIFRKSIAVFFLGLLAFQILVPCAAWALTTGPSQPESKQFAEAGTSETVDMFTGAFKYNIPIMDIDGYPINLNYQSGVGMDDEASWVGLGWNLNVGAISRSLRGIPDDMNGDKVITEHYTAPKTTTGGRGTVKAEFFGGAKLIGLKGSLSLGIFSDTYTGIGAEFGINAGISLTRGSGALTPGLGVGLMSNTSNGVDVSPNITLALYDKSNENKTTNVGLSANLGYNTRQGLKSLTLNGSFGVTTRDWDNQAGSSSFDVGGIGFTYNTPPFYPHIGVPYRSTNRSYSIDVGPSGAGAFAGVGLTGYRYKREILNRINTNPAYGYLYANQGKDVPNAVMDFMREKDNAVIPNMPNIAIPIATADIFSYSSQLGSGQFRLHRGGSGTVFDPAVNDANNTTTLGVDLGFGLYFHGGVTFYKQDVSNKTGKWKNNNQFNEVADYKNTDNTLEEHAYFKQMDEKNVGSNDYETLIRGEDVVHVSLDGPGSKSELKDGYNNTYPISAPNRLTKKTRQVRRNAISYLTASETYKGGVIRMKEDYRENKVTGFTPALPSAVTESRYGTHLSEFTITGDDGKRMVYSLPVYNKVQEEYSFATDPNAAKDEDRNLVGFSLKPDGGIQHNYGIDKYFHKETQPAYASAFLLSAILSPDYVDVTGDGISDDDMGTAIKFNYTKVNGNYKWRSPMKPNRALYNKALNADQDDDKSSIVYGEKEIWLLNSIETKNKVMFFLLDSRNDALGVTGITGAIDNTVNGRQRCLKEVRLYSKKDLTTPIKTAVFNYEYSLCQKVPNQAVADSGKLTLTGLHFTYGASTKGKHFPYTFKYTGKNPDYEYLSTDRWGNYKAAKSGLNNLNNDRFPYSTQDKAIADQNASAWNLTDISLPTGGEIHVDYESGDYAYVQDKQAMQMVELTQLVDKDGNPEPDFFFARGFMINIKESLNGASAEEKKNDFIRRYLNGERDFYAKLFVNLTDKPDNGTAESSCDYVPCYGKVKDVIEKSGGNVAVIFDTMGEGNVTSNPFIFAAWQKMRLEYPKYAYPGYKNRISDDMPIQAALGALVNSISNLSEITGNFYKRAERKRFARSVDLKKSFGRIAKVDGIKLGGAARVKRVRISDIWNTISGEPLTGATYGQEYTYTTTWNGKTISSGVASYEPGVGGDENPLRLPVPYTEDVKGGLNNYYYLEKPFGETLFPAPVVGYSKVVVKDLNAEGVVEAAPKTGWVQHEFYTSKDFPVQVSYDQSPDAYNYDSKGWFSFIGSNVAHELVLSQGYVVKLNDMHGKPKAERVFNQSGAEIANTSYYFNAKPLGVGTQTLVNNVDVVNEKGEITQNQVIGREIEMMVDMREEETSNTGRTIRAGFDMIPGFPIPWVIPHWPMSQNDEYRLFRSASVLKTVQYSGVLDRVVKTINGSTVTTKNTLYDAITGDPVVTTTNNEFDDPVYQVNMPAYWMNSGMSGAYKNNNALIRNFETDFKGKILSTFTSFVTTGDELIDLKEQNSIYWVVKTLTKGDQDPSYKLINKDGIVAKNFKSDVKLARSGYRNQLTAPGASVVCLKNPVQNGAFRFTTDTDDELASLGVLDASVTLYDQSWGARLKMEGIPDPYVYERPDRGVYIRNPNANDRMWPYYALYKDSQDGNDGTSFYAQNGAEYGNRKGYFWGGNGNTGRLTAIGMYPRYKNPNGNDLWYAYNTDITLEPAASYSLGLGGNDEVYVYIDGVEVRKLTEEKLSNHRKWHVFELANMLPGKHNFEVMGRNSMGQEAGFAAEIYNKSAYELYNTGNYTNIIAYSSEDLIHYPADVVERQGELGTLISKEDYVTPIIFQMNPFLYGFLGNWRPIEQKAFLVNRIGQQLSIPDIRKGGVYQNFTPYWYFSVTDNLWKPTYVNNEKWVSTGTATLFDAQGNGLESKDPLGIFKSALFSFNNTLTAAVASNAMQREIFYDGFEDYAYRVKAIPENSNPKDSFNMFVMIRDKGQYTDWLDNKIAHTGKYSLKLNSPLVLYTRPHENVHHTLPYLDFSDLGEYMRTTRPNVYPMGFAPKPGAEYIFSAWVKDAQPAGSTSDLKVSINDVDRPLTVKASVEGWKLVELRFYAGPTASSTALTLSAGSATRIDDIRILPVAGNIKTYAYDPQNQRLMAQLDENNLATLYEYDDEGTLIRLKKETDRGIMTIKENRSSYRAKN